MRSAGVLLPVFSIDSEYGIGTLGKSAYDFISLVSECGMRYWQILPLGPTCAWNSPYQCSSSYAGNPLYIDPGLLFEDGLITSDELNTAKSANTGRVDYDRLREEREPLFSSAYERGRERYSHEIDVILSSNKGVRDHCLFMAFSEKNGTPYSKWPEEIRRHEARELAECAIFEGEFGDRVRYHAFLQLLFFRQWDELHAFAKENSVGIIGDLPIYVAPDGADVWAEQEFYRLDESSRQTACAGVPPDAFSESGQCWGNPLYDWDAMKRNGYGPWIRRIAAAGRLFDVIRIDHFRGIESFYVIPEGKNDARFGHWEKGPGIQLPEILNGWFPRLEFIAEDLGIITPEVEALRERSGWPGMNVLEFAFDKSGTSKYLPHNHTENSICYTGTHDNDTLAGFLKCASSEDKAFMMRYLGEKDEAMLADAIIRAGLMSVSKLFIVQLQDILGLGSEARINIPGTVGDNWTYRVKGGDLDKISPDRIRDMLALYGRT